MEYVKNTGQSVANNETMNRIRRVIVHIYAFDAANPHHLN